MASGGNWFETRRKAYNLRTVELTTSSTVTTYTAKTGRATDGFVTDAVILVTTTEGNNMTITVPDGTYAGQQLMIAMVAEGSAETVDASTTTGDDLTQLTGAGAWGILIWRDDTNGWDEMCKGT